MSRHFWSLSGSPILIFRLVVVGIILSTATGVVYAVTNRPAFVTSFPGAAAPMVYVAFLIIAAMEIVALIGLLRWRRWAVWLYGVLALATVVLDVNARAPLAHHVAVIVGAAAVLSLAYLNRGEFRRVEATRTV